MVSFELLCLGFRVMFMVGQMQMKYERKANKIAGNSGSEQNITLNLFIPRSIGLEIFFSEYQQMAVTSRVVQIH